MHTDFNFLHGRWRVHNRRLRAPLTGSDEWDTFDGHTIERPLWGGRANLEEYEATLPDAAPLRGLALRLYDPARGVWTIHWSNARAGTLDAPMVGTFAHGVGEFHGDDVCDGRPVRARFRWTHQGPNDARWEQAYSADGGATWETNWVMTFARQHPLVELRRYTLHPGRRDALIALFEREFVEPQEAVGCDVLAQFRDVDRPDVFVWLRGFRDSAGRAAALGAFYDGPVWARHRDAANATMIDSDDVRLIRPARPGAGVAPGPRDRWPDGPPGLVVCTVYTSVAAPEFAAWFAEEIRPRLAAAGGAPVAEYETAPVANDFPRLPVREGERVFVTLARFDDAAAHARHLAALDADPRWAPARDALARRLARPAEVWRLTPTARSRELREPGEAGA